MRQVNLRPGQFINLPYFGEERKALNVDGTPFTLEEFMKVISANLVTKERLKGITEEIEHKSMEGVDEEVYRWSTMSSSNI